MCWEFFKFWGGCIVTGWHIGDGIFGAVVEFCLLTSAGLFALKFLFKKFNWKKLWKKWEEIVMKWAFILFLGSFLIAAVFVAPFLEYEKANPAPAASAIPAIPKVAATPLPTKIIPRPAPPPPPLVISTQQMAEANVETQKPFENFNVSTEGTDDITKKIAKIKAGDVARKEAEHRQHNLDAQKQWEIYSPYYQHSLVVLHDILYSKSANGDGISQSDGYFQCLPSAIDCNTGAIKVAEIKFQKKTNMDFFVTIDGLNWNNHRHLHISCSDGDLDLEPADGNRMRGDLHLNPDIDEQLDEPITNANYVISQTIKDLVDGQLYFLSSTNK